jgi:opacity protein-like surface antigen
MKKILLASALVALTTTAFAADLKPYVEGQLGYANLNNVDTKTLSITSGTFRASGKMGFEYDSDATYGAEIGLRDVLIPNLRIGASYSRAEFDMNKANLSVSASVNGGSTTLTGSATRSQLGSYADTFDAKINLYMLNAYYDFKNSSPFTPFVGAGIGFADVKNTKDNEFAYSFSAGAKYNFTQNVYLGAKGTYLRVNGPTVQVDSVNVGLEDVDMWKAEALLGYEF